MDEQAIRDQIHALVIELAPIQAAAITGETLVVVDLGYDSLRLVELAVALEDHFGLRSADEEDVTDVETVADVEERVLAMLAVQQTDGGAR